MTALSNPRSMVTIELFGVPRLLAGIGCVRLEARTMVEALTGLTAVCPKLAGTVVVPGGLHPAYRVSLNGDRFVVDPETPLIDGDALLLLAADVGG
jgi:hypothetical protein